MRYCSTWRIEKIRTFHSVWKSFKMSQFTLGILSIFKYFRNFNDSKSRIIIIFSVKIHMRHFWWFSNTVDFGGKPTIFFVIFWGTWGCFSWKIWVCNDMKKRGMSPKGNFRKDGLTILLSLWCRMISTPNSGKGTEFFLSTRSEFNSAKMQSTECMEGAEEIQGPDLVTLRLELVTFSFSYSSVISSISSSICK